MHNYSREMHTRPVNILVDSRRDEGESEKARPAESQPDIRGTRRGPRLPLILAPSRLSRALFVSLTTTMSTHKNTPPKSFRDVPVKQRSIWESWAGTTHTLAF